jgi:hypothetical protein
MGAFLLLLLTFLFVPVVGTSAGRVAAAAAAAAIVSVAVVNVFGVVVAIVAVVIVVCQEDKDGFQPRPYQSKACSGEAWYTPKLQMPFLIRKTPLLSLLFLTKPLQ